MKKSLTGFILVLTTLFIPSFVYAASACSYSEQVELNNIVANVKVNYEEAEREVDAYNGDTGEPMKVSETYFDINITNITDDIYIKVKNDYTKGTSTYYVSDANNGTITFKQTNLNNIINYTIEIYSNRSACKDELYRTIQLSTPVFNYRYSMMICENRQDFYYCQKYLTTEIPSDSEFYDKLETYNETHPETEKEKQEETKNKSIKEFYQDNKIIINIIISVILVLGVMGIVILIKRKRSRVL